MESCPVVSPYTNRRTNNETFCTTSSPIFWCETCSLKLDSPHIALQHMTGHSHTSKVNFNNKQENTVTKRKLQNHTQAQDDNLKKAKVQETGPLYCSDCDVTLNSAITSKMHFNGRKHAFVMSTKKKWPLPCAASVEHVTSQNEQRPEQNVTTGVKKKEKSMKSYCYDCQVELNSDEQGIQHYNGTKHKINVGIIAEPPGWSAKRGRGQSDDDGASRGRGIGSLHVRGQSHVEGFQLPLHGEVISTQAPEISEFGQLQEGSGWFEKKLHRSARRGGGVQGHGSPVQQGDFPNRRNTGVLRGQEGRGVNGRIHRGMTRGSNKGKFGVRGKDTGRKPPQRGISDIGELNNIEKIRRATVPGGKGKLSNYFVTANDPDDRFQQCVSNDDVDDVDDVDDAGEDECFRTEDDSMQDSSKFEEQAPLLSSPKLESKSEEKIMNVSFQKATVLSGSKPLSGYFVNASSNDRFTIKSDNKKGTGPRVQVSSSGEKVQLQLSPKLESKNEHKTMIVNSQKATVLRGSKSLNGYFVNASSNDQFTITPDNKKVSAPRVQVSPDMNIPFHLSPNLEGEWHGVYASSRKATVSSENKTCHDNVSSSSNEKFKKITGDNKKASVLGKSLGNSLSDYFVGGGTRDHFKPEEMTDTTLPYPPGYKQTSVSTYYSPSRTYYYNTPTLVSPSSKGIQDPQEYFEAMLSSSSTEKVVHSNTSCYAISNFSNVRNGYVDMSSSEYQKRNAAAKCDSFYAAH